LSRQAAENTINHVAQVFQCFFGSRSDIVKEFGSCWSITQIGTAYAVEHIAVVVFLFLFCWREGRSGIYATSASASPSALTKRSSSASVLIKGGAS